MSFNENIDKLKKKLPVNILNNIKFGDYQIPDTIAVEQMKNTFSILSDEVEDQIEVQDIYCILQDELVLELFFTREYINNFKSNPKKFATAKCISHMSTFGCDYIDKYVLLVNHKSNNSYIVYYVTDDNKTCLEEVWINNNEYKDIFDIGRLEIVGEDYYSCFYLNKLVVEY